MHNCMSREVGPGVLTHVQNPVTREEIKLNPPLCFSGEDQLNVFIGHVEDYCVAAWNIGRLSPAEINAPFGWCVSHQATADAMAKTPDAGTDGSV